MKSVATIKIQGHINLTKNLKVIIKIAIQRDFVLFDSKVY